MVVNIAPAPAATTQAYDPVFRRPELSSSVEEIVPYRTAEEKSLLAQPIKSTIDLAAYPQFGRGATKATSSSTEGFLSVPLLRQTDDLEAGGPSILSAKPKPRTTSVFDFDELDETSVALHHGTLDLPELSPPRPTSGSSEEDPFAITFRQYEELSPGPTLPPRDRRASVVYSEEEDASDRDPDDDVTHVAPPKFYAKPGYHHRRPRITPRERPPRTKLESILGPAESRVAASGASPPRQDTIIAATPSLRSTASGVASNSSFSQQPLRHQHSERFLSLDHDQFERELEQWMNEKRGGPREAALQHQAATRPPGSHLQSNPLTSPTSSLNPTSAMPTVPPAFASPVRHDSSSWSPQTGLSFSTSRPRTSFHAPNASSPSFTSQSISRPRYGHDPMTRSGGQPPPTRTPHRRDGDDDDLFSIL